MANPSVRRRTFIVGAVTATVALAGCGDDEGADDDQAENETDDEETEEQAEVEEEPETRLIVHLENEDGDPVSSGVEVTIVPDEGVSTYTYREDIEDGTIVDMDVPGTTVEPGEYTVTAEGEEFETVEETVTVEENEETEVTLVLEGAPGDDEEAPDDEAADGDEDEEDDGEEDGEDDSEEGDGGDDADD
ncbi:PEGA domain-containing protein [Natrononativus amylolyticus]|uniref:PEGA domain-containing protein n=1 Tax=Natrononativus amylolyticus TaxID=2963434 RepID=UPI0020CD34CF|nr:PEGA domain-containing protein [Natrononativus amylolyticus]